MAVATLHALDSIINGASIISQIENARPTPGVELLVADNAGRVAPNFAGVQAARPEITFDTGNLAQVLTLTGETMADLSAAVTYLYFAKVDEFGERTAGAVHTRLGAQTAALVCNQITAGHRDLARASCRLVIPYNGTNLPLIPAGTVALGSAAVTAQHYLAGPVSINTVALQGIQSITVDFGITLYELGGGGELYDTFVAVQTRRPTVTIQCLDLPWTTFLPAGAGGLLMTALTFYFRLLGPTGPVADASAVHVKFTAGPGLVTIDETRGGGNDPAVTTVRITPTSATGTTIFTIATASAIT